MSMKGIDISHWQDGINLQAVPYDFAIMKATEGTYYVDPCCDKFYQVVKSLDRGRGVYHYANGGNYKAEADFFLKNIQGYIGDAVLALDWEGTGNPLFNTGKDNAWIKNWCDYVYQKTGVKPIVYTSKAYLSRVQGIGDYGLWIAQYANKNPTGYQENPWNEGAYSCAIRQYTSTGRLSGYNGNLDLDKFYGDRAAWDKYANPDGTETSWQVPGEILTNYGLKYRAHCQTAGWLPWVQDGQVAGTIGYRKRLEAIQIDTAELKKKYPNAKLNVKAHLQGYGWKLYEDVQKDTLIGSEGESKRLEAIEMELIGVEGKQVYYRTHLTDVGWTNEIKGGFTSGTVGISKSIEAIQIYIK